MTTKNGPTWPKGTGQWSRVRTVIVAADADQRQVLMERLRDDTAIVAAPLDLIAHLEDRRSWIWTIVLAGSGGSAGDGELATFLAETYPWIRVVDAGAYLPALA